jgi:hypothetical protein|tara:strand:- start:172 stop:441 length:270 start_codon:yes stop_codon:yes gene_type:complete
MNMSQAKSFQKMLVKDIADIESQIAMYESMKVSKQTRLYVVEKHVTDTMKLREDADLALAKLEVSLGTDVAVSTMRNPNSISSLISQYW